MPIYRRNPAEATCILKQAPGASSSEADIDTDLLRTNFEVFRPHVLHAATSQLQLTVTTTCVRAATPHKRLRERAHAPWSLPKRSLPASWSATACFSSSEKVSMVALRLPSCISASPRHDLLT